MKKNSEAIAGYLFAAPWIIGLIVFAAYPICMSLYYSLCDYSVLTPPVFSGLHNYQKLFKDSNFYASLFNTVLFALVAVPLGTIVNMSIAMLLNSPHVKGMSWWRTIFYIPSLVPAVPLAVLGLQLFNADHGLVNIVLHIFTDNGPLHDIGTHLPATGALHDAFHSLGWDTVPAWLSDPRFSKPLLVLLAMWTGGGTVVIYLAGLQEVPKPLYEAAELDGATPWQKTVNVTIPLLSPVILFNVIMAIIGSLQYFTQAYVLFGAGGAPERSTYFYAMMMYENAFSFQKMGYASAMGWILFIIILILTVGALKFSEKRVHYEGG